MMKYITLYWVSGLSFSQDIILLMIADVTLDWVSIFSFSQNIIIPPINPDIAPEINPKNI